MLTLSPKPAVGVLSPLAMPPTMPTRWPTRKGSALNAPDTSLPLSLADSAPRAVRHGDVDQGVAAAHVFRFGRKNLRRRRGRPAVIAATTGQGDKGGRSQASGCQRGSLTFCNFHEVSSGRCAQDKPQLADGFVQVITTRAGEREHGVTMIRQRDGSESFQLTQNGYISSL